MIGTRVFSNHPIIQLPIIFFPEEKTMNDDFAWWITGVDLPAMGGLFWLIWKTRRYAEVTAARMREVMEARNAQLREALSSFKLEVAKNYASISDMRELESRLVGHLLRIEAKLDATAMKTEALRAERGE
jgi:hypothetical protein